MSDFLQHLQILQEQPVTMSKPVPVASKTNFNQDNIVILDLTKDPDPHGIHGIALSTRLIEMGWE